MLTIHVLGSAAGGGLPQWNCNCPQCMRVRSGGTGVKARTQSSVAVSRDGGAFALVNASPDIRAQILAMPALQPARGVRDTAIRGIVLIDAQIDHVTGLLMLRESTQPLELYCTARVHEDLTSHFPIVSMLEHYCGVNWHEIPIDSRSFSVIGVEGVEFCAVPLRSKAPPYSPHRTAPAAGDNIGLRIIDARSGHSAFYAPGLGSIDETVLTAMRRSQLLLVDGTTWTDHELESAGVGSQTARDMGHLPQKGAGGMLELLARFPDKRRVLIHINNTNPALDARSPEHAELVRASIELAYDGMVIEV